MLTIQRRTSILKFLFTSTQPVGRATFAKVGFGLAGLKYLGDQAIVWSTSGTFWTPWQYLSPFLSDRAEVGFTVLTILGLWALPFVWVGVSMTARRATDAGIAPGLAFFFFVPVINYLLIACLLAVRSVSARKTSETNSRGTAFDAERPGRFGFDRDLLVGLGASAAVAAVIAILLLIWSGSDGYALSLFFGAPFLIGAAAALAYNHGNEHGFGATLAVAQLALLTTAGLLLLSGVEGLICLAMAYPLAVPLVALGCWLGYRIAQSDRPRAMAAMLLLFPAVAFSESAGVWEPPLREVVSSIEIDAPPEVVWTNVVAVSELPPPQRWVFKAGIAYPIRARYVGTGERAIRYCEFSTGSFVEPVTVWNPPHRLSFDVTAQPPTMDELSPYADLQPAHITESLRSERGEFRLVRLAGNRTRLEGSTWYTVDMQPQWYWGLWSDALIHAIHVRVLEHIRDEIETQPNTGVADA